MGGSMLNLHPNIGPTAASRLRRSDAGRSVFSAFNAEACGAPVFALTKTKAWCDNIAGQAIGYSVSSWPQSALRR